MTAAALLALCDSLAPDFVEELIGRRRITAEEAHGILALRKAWGLEPAFGRGRAELRADLRRRVLAFLDASRSTSVGAVQ